MRKDDIFTDYMLHDMRVQIQLLQNNVDWILRCAQDKPIWAGETDVTECLFAVAENALLLTSLLSGMIGRRDSAGDTTCDIGALIEQITATVVYVAKALNKQCTCLVEGDPVISANPILVERIVYNLLSNALRHTPEDSVVRLLAKERQDDVLIRITDEGEGLDKYGNCILTQDIGEDCSAVKGMGLRIVRSLVDEMGGRISVNEAGKGTAVDLIIPKERAGAG